MTKNSQIKEDTCKKCKCRRWFTKKRIVKHSRIGIKIKNKYVCNKCGSEL